MPGRQGELSGRRIHKADALGYAVDTALMKQSPPRMLAQKPMRFAFTLIAIGCIAFGIRLAMTAAFVGLDSPPDISASPDQAEYDAILQQLAAGNGYAKHDGQPTARRAPGMVFTLLPVYLLSGGSYAAVRIMLILLSATTCVLVGLAAARAFSPRCGIIAAAILAFIPGHTYYAMHLLSETPFAFWFAAAVLLSFIAMRRERKRWILFVAAGLAWGMAVLTKPQFILLAPLVVLGGAAYSFRAASWRPAIACAICLTAASAVVMPWYARNAVVLDAPGLSTIGGYSLWAGNNELVLDDPAWRGRAMPTSQVEAGLGVKLPEGEAASDAQAKAYAVEFMRTHRSEMPRLTLWKLYRFATPFQATENRAVYWAQAISWIVLAPLLTAGLLIAWRRRSIESLLWIAPIVVTIGVTVVFFAIVRYRDALLPAIVPIAALAIDSAWRRFATASERGVAGSISPADSESQNKQLAA